MVDSPLNPNAGASDLASAQSGVSPSAAPQYSPEFLQADSFMAQLAGDKIPKSLRYQYWQELDGDKLAKHDPRAAAIAYDTAIMVNPQAAFNLVKQTKGDPTKMYQVRNTYAEQMIAKDPAKYGGMAESWKAYTTNQGRALGLVPADDLIDKRPNTPLSVPPGDLIDKRPNTPSTVPAGEMRQPLASAATTAPPGSLKELIDRSATAAGINPRKMYGIVAGESGHGSNYDTNVSDREASYGPFQLNRKGGLGNVFEKETGLSVTDPSTIPAQAEWVAKYLAKDPNMNVGKMWFGYKGDTDWNPKWGNAGYLGGESPATKPSDSGKPVETATDKTTEPKKSTFEQAADAAEAKKPEAAPAIPITRPNIALPTEPIAPAQRDMYARALDAISKRNASTPPTQPAKPPEVQEKTAMGTPVLQEPTPSKEPEPKDDTQA